MRPQLRRLLESAGFSPRQLFAALQGAWLEPTPGFIWRENTGINPTTTGGQTIGLVLDQSQGAVLGPELMTNGMFGSNISGWTTYGAPTGVWNSEALEKSITGLGSGGTYQDVPVTPGLTYRITGAVINTVTGSGSASAIQVWNNNAFTTILHNASFGAGTHTTNVTVLATNSWLRISCFVGGATGGSITSLFDNVSVREIFGNHAAQSTAANRPTYQLDSNGLPLARHDATDSLVVSLPNLGGGIYSASGSVYFATPQGMSALHGQSMGTTYTLPALSTDIYAWMVFPQRLTTAQETRLERYMLRKAGLAVPDYLTDDAGEILTDDIGDPLLAG